MPKPENSTLINICIIPDEETTKRFISVSQTLIRHDPHFVLGEGKFPHMTVYMARFADDRIEDLVKTVKETESLVQSFACQHVGYFLTEGRYLEASFRRSPEIIELHENIIQKVSHLRLNPGAPFNEDYFHPFTEEQQKHAKETGYDLARNLYRPHVTLTRYKEGKLPNIFPSFPEVELSFPLTKIGIYKADDNGAVYEKIEELRIG